MQLEKVLIMTVLEEIGHVLRCRPSPTASVEEVAHWYEQKALLLEHIAASGGRDARVMRRQAYAAHRHAEQLLSGPAIPAPRAASRFS